MSESTVMNSFTSFITHFTINKYQVQPLIGRLLFSQPKEEEIVEMKRLKLKGFWDFSSFNIKILRSCLKNHEQTRNADAKYWVKILKLKFIFHTFLHGNLAKRLLQHFSSSAQYCPINLPLLKILFSFMLPYHRDAIFFTLQCQCGTYMFPVLIFPLSFISWTWKCMYKFIVIICPIKLFIEFHGTFMYKFLFTLLYFNLWTNLYSFRIIESITKKLQFKCSNENFPHPF